MRQVTKPVDHTGGHFSVGYIVENADGRHGFLKALDYSLAFETDDPPAWLAWLTSAYVHERELLYRCRDERLRRVAVPIDDGTVTVPGHAGPLANVSYLIFELADGDVRKRMDAEQVFDCAWRMRTLHHAATALQELHWRKIAHQDVKASNVLSYSGEDTKVTDLGTASVLGGQSPTDGFDVAGDPSHAPFELVYGHRDPDWTRRRLGCDLYLLGSLAVFLITRVRITPAVVTRLDESHRPQVWTGTYLQVLPYVIDAWDQVMTEFASVVKPLPSLVGQRLETLVRQLSHPDPYLRGDPLRRLSVNSDQYNLVRYVSFFNQMAAECQRKRSK